jgi:hypothetical protein
MPAHHRIHMVASYHLLAVTQQADQFSSRIAPLWEGKPCTIRNSMKTREKAKPLPR